MRLFVQRAAFALMLTACVGPAMQAHAAPKEPVMHHATGTFEVKMQPQGEVGQAGSDGNSLGRMSLDKTFSGDLVGTGSGEMLAARSSVPTSASYVAIERVTGTLDGKAGTFVLVHRGVMRGETQQLEVTISPESGTGALAGIAGKLGIRIEGGKHYYDLDYTLPAAP
ncbi:Protein of unknown function [Pseudoxanthomonas sp. GM95]|uniref:DUF3224 domain-containing protein n=1 Tax=Pseudoxanthomonas sp. GM95 TaxID=1881043 RepID=UPI0008B6B99E|nr:DUF3224 domain-containing protein [Pseudoxanthomonas sp. GM95]SEM08176.1 Protein of unknown function [Pseudoxanthomonas sp. GM95]